MNWDDVRIFLEVDRHGSLSGASRKLKVDQTTVGRRLAALETALGARLFDRMPEGLKLTPEGEAIREAALGMEHASLELALRVGGADAQLGGTVRVATSEAFAVRFLVGALATVRARHPEITLDLVTGHSSVDLARREADVALRFRPRGVAPAQPHLVARKVVEIAFALYASKAYLERAGVPAVASGLAGHDIIGFDEDLTSMPGLAWLREHAGTARVTMRCGSFLTAISAANADFGVAVLPCFMADVEPLLRRVSDPIDRNDGWLVVHPDRRLLARVRVVMDVLAEVLAANAPAFEGGTTSLAPPL